MIRRIYVVTTEPGGRRRAVRQIVFLIVARIVVALAWAGHTVAQLAGALDAIVAARLGTPRLAVLARRVRAALYATWGA